MKTGHISEQEAKLSNELGGDRGLGYKISQGMQQLTDTIIPGLRLHNSYLADILNVFHKMQ